MIYHLPLALFLSLTVFTEFTAAAYQWPSPQYDTLEGYLYEGRRSDGSSVASIVHPCRKRTGTLSSIAAEWLRFAFHDMSTHNVDDGTGGLDGSIVYELDRQENFSLGFNQTRDDFQNFANKYVSRADVIALGAVFAVSTCSGPIIPFRGGRVDVYTGGPRGVPEPQQDLPTLTEIFRKEGFNQAEMIKLLACGHSMGGVRDADFPQLVPAGPTPGVPNIIDFDTTMAFDNAIVNDYLSGTTQNVLVVGPNATMNSDLRVFASDGNVTMRSLATATVYASECQAILERMLNTVASNVTLTDEITLLPVKVSNMALTIEKSQLVLKTTLRLAQATNSTVNKARTVLMLWCDKNGADADCSKSSKSAAPASTVNEDPNISPVTLKLGYSFITYSFVVPVDPTQSVSKFWFEVDEHDGSTPTTYDNGGNNYVVSQDQILFIPTLSHSEKRIDNAVTKGYTNRDGETFTSVYTVVAAVRDGINPSRVYVDAFDNSNRDFAEPLNKTIDLTLNSTLTPVMGYSFYSGVVEDVGFQLTLDFHVDAGESTFTDPFKATTFLDNTPFVAPTNVTSTSGKPTSASSSIRTLDIWNHSGFTSMFGLLFGISSWLAIWL